MSFQLGASNCSLVSRGKKEDHKSVQCLSNIKEKKPTPWEARGKEAGHQDRAPELLEELVLGPGCQLRGRGGIKRVVIDGQLFRGPDQGLPNHSSATFPPWGFKILFVLFLVLTNKRVQARTHSYSHIFV